MILDSEELEFLNSPISALLGLRNGTSGVYLEEPGNPFSKADHKGEEKGTEADHAQTPVNPPTDTESHDRDPRRLSDGPVVRFFGSFEDENAARFVEARPLGQERFGIPQMGIGIFSLAVQPGFLASRFTTTLGDLNNDGLNDLVIADRVSNFITVFLGLGNNTYQEVRRFQSGFGVMALATGDFNGDNHLDLAVATKGGNNISILLGDGFGGFRYVSSFKSVAHPDGIIVADLDGDGTLDLAVLDLGLREIQAFVGNGTGHFAKAAGLEAGIEANSIPTQDWLPGDRIRSIEFVRWGRSVSLSVTYVGGIIESIANFDAGLHQFIGLGNFLDTGKVDLAVGTFVGLIHQ
ncbi:MAG: VCBS repeat-containing protein [Acidobacteria bacterium]|nr:VCBS repeat-containing protein [Acidobacteriota bacterium]MBI3656634.1 VCBS repeat-containing protein [Acidobacteriota bacterium]